MTSWGDFAQALTVGLQVPDSIENVDAFLAWFLGEQPPGQPNGAFNPLNIQSGGYPHVGVTRGGQYEFGTFAAGVAATVSSLHGSYYTAIINALRADDNAIAVLEAVQASPWAQGHYGYRLPELLATIRANRPAFLAGEIAGIGGPSGPSQPMEEDLTSDEMELVLIDATQKGLILNADQVDLVVIEATKPLADRLDAIATHLGLAPTPPS